MIFTLAVCCLILAGALIMYAWSFVRLVETNDQMLSHLDKMNQMIKELLHTTWTL